MANKVISVMLNAIVAPYQANMARAAASTQAFGAQAAAAGRGAASMGSQVGMLNPKLIGAAGLAFALKSTVDSAMEFESSFAGVRKTVDATESQFADLSDGFREMALQIPVNVNELNRIGEAAGQLGIETENIEGFTRVMADLGVATNMSSEQAATSLARLANITQMSEEDFDRLGSVVVDLGNNMATTEAEITEMGLRLAGAGAQVGMTESEILGLAAALSDVGINAEAGGSALSKVMIEIASEVENSGDKVETFARVAGMSADEFSTAWRDDATGALTAFITGLGNMEGQGQSTLQVLEELGITEVRMRDALLRTSGAGDQLTHALSLANNAWEENNALTKEAEQRYATTESKVQLAKNAFEDLKIELGNELLPVVGEVAAAFNRLFALEVGGQRFSSGLVESLKGVVPGMRGFWMDTDQSAEALERHQTTQAAARSVMDNYTQSLEAMRPKQDEAAESTGELAEQVEYAEEVINVLGEAISGFMTPLSTYQEMVREVAETTAAETDDAEDSWEDFADSAEVSLADVAESLRKQVRNQQEWETNLVTIASRAGADVALQLAEMGSEGVGLVAEMADASDLELQEMARLFRLRAEMSGENYITGLADRLDDADGTVRRALSGARSAADISGDLYSAAILSGDGWVRGMNFRSGAMAAAAAYAANRAANAARSELGIESPSKVFEEIGEQTVAGYTVGVDAHLRDVDQVMEGLTGAAMAGVISQPQSPTTVTHSGVINIHMPPGSDGDDVVRALQKYERRNGPVPVKTRG